MRTRVSRVFQRDTLPFVTSKCRYEGVRDVAECCRVLQSVAVCCNVLQCEDRCISRIANETRSSPWPHNAGMKNFDVDVVQCVAMCCSVLQCVAV